MRLFQLESPCKSRLQYMLISTKPQIHIQIHPPNLYLMIKTTSSYPNCKGQTTKKNSEQKFRNETTILCHLRITNMQKASTEFELWKNNIPKIELYGFKNKNKNLNVKLTVSSSDQKIKIYIELTGYWHVVYQLQELW